MAGSGLTSLHSCGISYNDNTCLQLQLSREPTAPSLHARRKNRPFLQLRIHACTHPVSSPFSLPDSHQGRSFGFRTRCHPQRKNSAKISVVCTSAKTMLDRCSNDANDALPSDEPFCREKVLAALQRSLLESQWALESARSLFETDERLKLENYEWNPPPQSAAAAVRSGQASARQRRLCSRSNLCSQNKEDSLKDMGFTIPAKLQGKTKKGKFKVDPLQDFISSFLRPTNGCGMFTKDQERGFTRQMRICQSLEKARRELRGRFGHDPSYKVWARSVHLSTNELISMVNNGELARNKMLYSHLLLVLGVAKHYQNLGVDTNDLIQEGSKGLLRGLEKFDHRKGCKLSTYVHWWIRQGMTRAIAEHSRLLRVPVYIHEIMFAIRGAKETLAHQGKPVTVENLSLLLKTPCQKVERALQAKCRVKSLDRKDNSYGLKMEFDGLHEFVADQNREYQPWDLLIEEDMRGDIKNRMTLLTLREQKIIRWAYGIDTKDGAQSSMAMVGKRLGISKERVRQLRARALSKMRRPKEDEIA